MKLETEQLREIKEREKQYRINLANLKLEQQRLDDTISYDDDEDLVPSKILKKTNNYQQSKDYRTSLHDYQAINLAQLVIIITCHLKD